MFDVAFRGDLLLPIGNGFPGYPTSWHLQTVHSTALKTRPVFGISLKFVEFEPDRTITRPAAWSDRSLERSAQTLGFIGPRLRIRSLRLVRFPEHVLVRLPGVVDVVLAQPVQELFRRRGQLGDCRQARHGHGE